MANLDTDDLARIEEIVELVLLRSFRAHLKEDHAPCKAAHDIDNTKLGDRLGTLENRAAWLGGGLAVLMLVLQLPWAALLKALRGQP